MCRTKSSNGITTFGKNSAVAEKFGNRKKIEKFGQKSESEGKNFFGNAAEVGIFLECDKCGREFRNENSVTGHKNEHKEMGAGLLTLLNVCFAKNIKRLICVWRENIYRTANATRCRIVGRSSIRIIF